MKLPLILDGATATNLYNAGMPKGVCVEQWIIENENALIALQKDFIENGSQAICAPTFGANAAALSHYGLGDKVREYNRRLTALSKKAAAGRVYIGGDISPTGLIPEPYGNARFDDIVDVYKEQASAILEEGIDFFICETSTDLREARAAVTAIKELCNLPVLALMTVDSNGRTLRDRKSVV